MTTSIHILNEKFNLTLTPKFHIIESHLKFYFQRTGKSLGFYTDQVVEAMHQFTDRRLTRSNYVVKDIQSDIHGEKLLNGIKHINSYKLKFKLLSSLTVSETVSVETTTVVEPSPLIL